MGPSCDRLFFPTVWLFAAGGPSSLLQSEFTFPRPACLRALKALKGVFLLH